MQPTVFCIWWAVVFYTEAIIKGWLLSIRFFLSKFSYRLVSSHPSTLPNSCYWLLLYFIPTFSLFRYFSVVLVEIPNVSVIKQPSPFSNAVPRNLRNSSLSQGRSSFRFDFITSSYLFTAPLTASKHFLSTKVSQAFWILGITPGLLSASTYNWTSAARPGKRH